jgi:uncharacterized protein (DUF2249 family)
MTEERPTLTLTEKHACACGEHDADLPELDARTIPHAIRHGAILGALGQLAPGSGLVLVAPHDPQPLLRQINDLFGEAVTITYDQRGPEAWKLRMVRA